MDTKGPNGQQPDAEKPPALRITGLSRPGAHGVSLFRMSHDGPGLETPASVPNDNAFSAIVQLEPFREHRLWREGKLLYTGGYEAGALAITDLRDSWQCHHMSSFDNLRIQIPFHGLRSFREEEDMPVLSGFRSPEGAIDPVAFHLAQALLPALQNPDEANGLFIDQICQALMTHLAATWGGQPLPQGRKGTLAPWQERRARDYLATRLAGEVSLGELARECNLSRGYFIRAFRKTLGVTPWRWLQEYRIDRAKELLLGEQPIAWIAMTCGFSDQSHMTRVFTAITGTSPGVWRRRNRTG